MLEGNRVSRISVRGFAVASATAVTAVGSVVGVASGSTAQNNDAEATASDATLLSDIPMGQEAQVQTASLTQQADAQAIAADASAKKDAEETARKKAASDAVAKQEAAEKAEAERKAKEAASRSASRDVSSLVGSATKTFSIGEIQAMAQQVVAADQWTCFSNIVDHESSWNYKAVNASSGAYGLFQALPGSKMSSVGSDWQTNPATQIKWGLNYMDSRYGSPCEAWSFWQANNWY
ncbi:aggregation-promoting factor C-terminal-like domain-containing protein [Streptomyces spongiae]|uniref:Lytic transglycosylase domain-containing protein n=1 Tax=Streptomyces spongiae TaxID=565072 RepID=A0A5N8XQV3_9ACTN|nr:transglycosylase SLT domain-containing protein [Streptomyces spongiae]MPY61800.1 lytic transglycosylase domain-containing protein [Streptomyces spongiae]